MTAPLSPAELATVARFDAGPDAPESLRERVAEALLEVLRTNNPLYYEDAAEDLADAALAVITGGAS